MNVVDEVSESKIFIKALERRRVKIIGHLIRYNVLTIVKGEVLKSE